MRRPRFRPIRLSIRHPFVLLCTCALFITLWIGGLSGRASSVAQATDVSELVQTGVEHYQAGNFAEAIEPWRSAYEAYNTTQELPALAIVSENLARAYQQMGQTSEEIVYWERAIASIQTLGDRPKLGRLLTEQAQAHSRLGQQRRAIAILCGSETDICEASSALQIAETAEDKMTQVAALGSLGEAYRLSGDAEKALTYLDRGRAIARELGDPVLESAILNSLGNTAASLAQVNYRRASEAEARGDREATRPLKTKATEFNAQAIEHFQQSYELALTQQDASAQVRSLLSLIPAHERADRLDEAQRYRALALTALNQLPDSQIKAFAAIQLADFLEPLSIRQSQILINATRPSAAVEAEAIALLNQALAIGEAIENSRVTSFAMGKLGNLDERSGRYAEALKKTQAARLAADQNLAARDSLYLWEWQLARILKAQDNLPASAQAYSQSIELLEQIRSDILNANRDLQFDFRDTVEPIYRQYAELNLKEVPDAVALTAGDKAFNQLDTALTTLDSLKVAELQSYFANDCVIVPTATRVDAVGDSAATAVFSTAILGNSSQADLPINAASNSTQLAAPQSTPQELAVIVSLPDGSKKISQISVPQTEIESQINRFRNTLESGRSQYINEYDFAPSQQLYQWLIAPFEKDLNNINTLVFVNDGLLRSVPMAALYDGKQFLIEKFAVATTPSLTLTAPERIKRPTELSALLMGVSEQPKVPGRSFAALQAVDQELASVAAQFPDSKTLLNQDFSVEALRATERLDLIQPIILW
jgi:CHAT domain-containing protein/tetratricopeptide (TPR) repeat protein